MNNKVKNIIKFLTKEECEDILKKCINELDLIPAQTYSENEIDRLNKKTPVNQRLHLLII